VAGVDLLPIGRFARLAGLTVRAVRFYGELGLLRPARVDERTGYRLYAPAQLDDAEAIKRLRSLDLSLEEIGELLPLDDALALRERLVRHRARMLERAAESERILADLDRLIEGKEPLVPDADVLYELCVEAYPEYPVLSIRDRVGADDVKRAIPAAYKELFAYLAELGEEAVEPWTITICPFADDEGFADLQNAVVTRAALPGRGRIESGSLPAVTALTLTARGPYERLGLAYRALQHWLEEHGVTPTGPPREIYVTDPEETSPEETVTVVAWPIRPEDAERARGSDEKFERPLPAPL
jgi:DNA-binding transcriptional MerR regulator